MKLFAISVAAVGLALLAPQASAQSGARECRDVTVSEGGVPKRTTLCRDSDGQWRPVTSNAAGQPLPPGFRGQITYRGTFDVVAQLAARGRQGPRQDREQGTFVSVVEYDGNLVTLSWTTNIAGQQRTGRATGTRQGSQCQLFEDKTQSPFAGTCDSAVFRGTVSNGPGERVSWRGTYDTAATETVDYAVRDRQRAEAAEAERRRIAAMPKPKLIMYTDMITLPQHIKCNASDQSAAKAATGYHGLKSAEREFHNSYAKLSRDEVTRLNEASKRMADACHELLRMLPR